MRGTPAILSAAASRVRDTIEHKRRNVSDSLEILLSGKREALHRSHSPRYLAHELTV